MEQNIFQRSNLIQQPVAKYNAGRWVYILSSGFFDFFRINERDLGKRKFSATIVGSLKFCSVVFVQMR